MKKFSLLIAALIFTMPIVFSQTVKDALRYSTIFYGGTARFMSMGGAFTALGADLSTLTQNPAGLGVFRSSEISLTPQLFYNKTSAGFNGVTTDYLYDFNLGQIGIAANIISNNVEEGLITLNFGYSYNKTSNLNSTIRIKGINNKNSMADYWADISYGFFKDELEMNVPDAFLANRVYVIDTLSGISNEYGSVFSNYGDGNPRYGQTVRRTITNSGQMGEHAFSIGGNYSNKLFFGLTLGISRLNYTDHYDHLESDPDNDINDFNTLNYVSHYEETGTGYSFKIGTIYKPVETVRLAFAFHSPTMYKIHDYIYDNMSSSFDDGYKYSEKNESLRFDYKLTTPFRALAGIALQVKKLALFSLDYEFTDYSTARFTHAGDDFDYSDKNDEIKDTFKSASNIRFGTEVRMNKLYLRGGYSYYGKALKEEQDNADLDYNSFSFGIGLRERNVFFDLGFTTISNSEKYFMYPGGFGFDAARVNLNSTRNMFSVTLGYKF
jgi:hypothetical protein